MLLDYLATYPNDGITYRTSDMVLCGHSDAGFNNESRSCSRAGAHIFLLEDDPMPRWNGPVLTIAQIMKYVLSLAAEAETSALFLTARESTAIGYTNSTIIPKKSKSWDLRSNWLRCREFQGQFRCYWDKGPNNWGDYSSKHHPPPCLHV